MQRMSIGREAHVQTRFGRVGTSHTPKFPITSPMKNKNCNRCQPKAGLGGGGGAAAAGAAGELIGNGRCSHLFSVPGASQPCSRSRTWRLWAANASTWHEHGYSVREFVRAIAAISAPTLDVAPPDIVMESACLFSMILGLSRVLPLLCGLEQLPRGLSSL